MRQEPWATRVTGTVAALLLAAPVYAGWPGDKLVKCPADSVKVGATCVDKYEASVWQLPAASLTTTAGKALIAKIQRGTVTLANLTAGGATQLAPAPSCIPVYGSSFPNDGNWTPVAGTSPPTPGIYAVSVAGVKPSVCLTWFQAEQACALSNKRLIRNQEWQRAAAGTKDPGSNDGLANTKCNTSGAGPRNTGLAGTIPGDATGCVSNWGAEDMVGNADEWVGDWENRAGGCTNWINAGFGLPASQDVLCYGTGADLFPGAVRRGGRWAQGALAGVFALDANSQTYEALNGFGFRCAR